MTYYRKDYLKVFVLRTIGNFLLLLAIAGVFLTFAPAIAAEVTYRYDNLVGRKFVVAGDETVAKQAPQGRGNFAGLLGISEPLSIAPLDPEFDLIIPKIGANARVVANVDPGNYNDYIEALRHGVAHAAGTKYPGQVGNTFLFAHSVGNFWEVSRWNAVFYLLRELNPGDEVDLFYLGRRYIYVVYDKKIVEPTDVGYLTTQANFPMLTMQTCWPQGTTFKRLLVFARLRQGSGG